MAYSEVFDDETSVTSAGFLLRAAAWFAAHGIPRIERVMTDNALTYRRGRVFQAAVAEMGAQQRFITPHCPWQNGKVERYNKTLAREWIYARVYTSNRQRREAIDSWLEEYNNRRPHTAHGGKPPVSVLSPTY